MTARFLFDSNIFIYATGGSHPLKPVCERLAVMQSEKQLRGEGMVLMLEEIFHQRRRQARDGQIALAYALAVEKLLALVHPVTTGSWRQAARVLSELPTLDSRDAIYAGVARELGVEFILSADHDFDQVQGITRIDPLDSARIERELVRD